MTDIALIAFTLSSFFVTSTWDRRKLILAKKCDRDMKAADYEEDYLFCSLHLEGSWVDAEEDAISDRHLNTNAIITIESIE